MKRICTLLGLMALSLQTVNAQRIIIDPQPHHEIGLAVGVANYYGDLQKNPVPDYGYKPMAGIVYKYFFNPRLGLRFGASFASVTAADSMATSYVQRQRNLRFSSNIFELHGGLEVNILPVDFNRSKISPYLFAGIGAFYADPYSHKLTGEKVFLRELSTEGQGVPNYPDRQPYSLVNASFPLGGGFKFFIGNAVMFCTEVGLRYTSYDYLDDVSKSYVNLDTLAAYRGRIASDFSFRGNELPDFEGNYPNYQFQRGDSKANDWYWFAGISVTVYFEALGNVQSYLATKCPGVFRRKK